MYGIGSQIKFKTLMLRSILCDYSDAYMMMIMNCFVVWLTSKRRLALFPARAIVRDPDHRESGFEDVQKLSSGFVE